MGRAIVRDPQVFLFDEPLSNLDAKLRVQMRAEIKELHQRLKTTTVYVTHDQVEAMTMADRIVVMRDGEVEQIGSRSPFMTGRRRVFVAGFLGSPAMNLLKGSIRINGKPSFLTETGSNWRSRPPRRASKASLASMAFGPSISLLGGDGPKAEVSVVEPTGSETQVLGKLGGQQIMGVFRERIAAHPGDFLPFVTEPRRRSSVRRGNWQAAGVAGCSAPDPNRERIRRAGRCATK